MTISLLAYAKADIRAAHFALDSVRSKEGNEKATKGIAAYHAQQAVEKIIKSEIYKANPDIPSPTFESLPSECLNISSY